MQMVQSYLPKVCSKRSIAAGGDKSQTKGNLKFQSYAPKHNSYRGCFFEGKMA